MRIITYKEYHVRVISYDSGMPIGILSICEPCYTTYTKTDQLKH